MVKEAVLRELHDMVKEAGDLDYTRLDYPPPRFKTDGLKNRHTHQDIDHQL
jgi:hypothetical protein